MIIITHHIFKSYLFLFTFYISMIELKMKKKILSKLIISFKETKWWWQSIQPITQLIVIEFCHFEIVVSFFTLFISIMMMTMMMMTRLRRRRLCRCRGRRRRRLSSSSSKFFLFGLVQQSYHSDIVYSICVFSYHFLFQDSKDFFFKIFHCSQSIYSVHLCCLFSFHIITHNKQAQNRTEHTSYWIYFFFEIYGHLPSILHTYSV